MRKALIVTDALTVVLILVQAMIAGQSLFAGANISIHGFVGNGTFVVAIVALVLAFVARVPVWLLALNGLLALLLFFQTGLGYVGRDSSVAASFHVPLGVTAFGLATAALVGAIVVVVGARALTDAPGPGSSA
jgi:hypothetical protein